MSTTSRVVAICGSLREASHTRVALQRALAASETAGADIELLDLRALEIPLFNADEPTPPDVNEMTATIRESDAIILGTPMYHGSYSGVVKNAVDHCGFDEFEDKTVGLLAVSGGSFPISALEHLRSVCRSLNAWVLPYEAAIPRASDAVEDGRIVDDRLGKRVDKLGVRLVKYASIEPHQEAFEGDQNVGAVGR